ncbi:coiled-coil domain-containing protein 96 [Drosophila ficusphila]|uniref:coiled-coil domain-containing protein 96 n=1 Tax=Drosophila ficusphila TaxID=30025 RepID=UPI001C894690|nr:coiled-coil domain-containing protein 96 [Drosophila ficusphila]
METITTDDAKNEILKDEVPKDQVVQDQVVQDQVVQDQVVQDQVVQDQVLQDPGLQNKVLQDGVLQEEVVQDKEMQVGVLQIEVSQEEMLQDKVLQVKDSADSESMYRESEMLLQEAKKEERRLIMRDALERLRQRDEETKLAAEKAESEHQMVESSKEKSAVSIQSRPSQLEKKEEDEQLMLSKLDDESSTTSSNSDVESFTGALLKVDAEYEEEPSLIKSSSESEPEPETQELQEVQESVDPLRLAVHTLMLVPDISEISMPFEPLKENKSLKSIKSERLQSQGQFKDALDMKGSDSESGSSESGSDTQSAAGDQMVESESLEESSGDIDLPYSKPTQEEPDQFLEELFAAAESRRETNVTVLPDSKASESHQIVYDFINQLFDKVIVLEAPGSEDYLRKRLDKNKLLVALQEAVSDYIINNDNHKQLEDRLIEYLRRTKNMRAFAELSFSEARTYRERHQEALDNLASNKKRLDDVKEKHSIQIQKSLMELSHAIHIAVSTEEHLEQSVRRLLVRPDAETDFLKRFVSRELRLMAEHRNQISDTRLTLIKQKHTLGRVREIIKKIETLSETVSVKDYINVQTKVLSLQKKIEERNIELKRQRTQYHTELHLTKHLREKSLELKQSIEYLKEKLEEKMEMRHEAKVRLYKAKIEHKKIRSNINECTYRGGILAMPALLYDYDRTVDYIKEKKEKVTNLRETLKSITDHLQAVSLKQSHSFYKASLNIASK